MNCVGGLGWSWVEDLGARAGASFGELFAPGMCLMAPVVLLAPVVGVKYC